MSYTVEYTPKALKTLEKMDIFTQRMILDWIEKKLIGSENPRVFGKPLTENLQGLWRYRIGDYRIIAKIQDNRLVILLINIGHRKEIYR